MKKIVGIIVSAVMLLSIAACSTKTLADDTSQYGPGVPRTTEAATEVDSTETGATETTDVQATQTESAPAQSAAETTQEASNKVKITMGDYTFTATLEENSSAVAFKELLAKGPITIDMHDYGNFEKVGSLGTSLPRNDTQITTTLGDIILYQGNQITIYYDRNSWSFTRLGKVDDTTLLREALGSGNVSVTFSLNN